MNDYEANYEMLLDTSMEIGCALLENGAEIYRVEDSIRRILLAYMMAEINVFAIPSCIITTIITRDGHTYTRMKRIVTQILNFNKLSEVNNLCRYICDNTPSIDEMQRRLQAINQLAAYPLVLQIFASGLISFAFCLFFGGGLVGAVIAAMCGIAAKASLIYMNKLNISTFFKNLLASVIIAVVAVAVSKIFAGIQVDKIIIGTLMNLVPGVAITNGIRDMLAGDMLSGVIKLSEVVLIAIAIASGISIVFF